MAWLCADRHCVPASQPALPLISKQGAWATCMPSCHVRRPATTVKGGRCCRTGKHASCHPRQVRLASGHAWMRTSPAEIVRIFIWSDGNWEMKTWEMKETLREKQTRKRKKKGKEPIGDCQAKEKSCVGCPLSIACLMLARSIGQGQLHCEEAPASPYMMPYLACPMRPTWRVPHLSTPPDSCHHHRGSLRGCGSPLLSCHAQSTCIACDDCRGLHPRHHLGHVCWE